MCAAFLRIHNNILLMALIVVLWLCVYTQRSRRRRLMVSPGDQATEDIHFHRYSSGMFSLSP